MTQRITVVVSQGQSQHPAKRGLEEQIAQRLSGRRELDVLVVPNLYDLRPDGQTMTTLREISGDLIVLAWLYPRASRWILDRHGVSGKAGESLLRSEEDDEEDLVDAAGDGEESTTQRVLDTRDLPARFIYCIDLRVRDSAEPFLEEVERILGEVSSGQLDRWLAGSPSAEALARFASPTNDTALGPPPTSGAPTAKPSLPVQEEASRRWYPVIDFSRCTNCMECIDFCLFGVYGIDRSETILVEQPDNCRKGCPACSRVCPENAIIFPQHKTPAIAGAPADPGGFKIDLSRLFGAPESAADALEVAVRERDEQLLAAGRETVGATVGVPKRQESKPDRARDELDDLIDKLDELDL